MNDFLPINKKEMLERGWQDVDFVFVTGDSYVDHPSFGVAILTRLLENKGYRVAVLSQPNWKNDGDFTQFGRPRLAFMVTSGNIDSMVAHYTAAKRLRHDDAYTAGGVAGKRPDRQLLFIQILLRGFIPIARLLLADLKRHSAVLLIMIIGMILSDRVFLLIQKLIYLLSVWAKSKPLKLLKDLTAAKILPICAIF